ncbi:histamine H2 receptor-like [Saccoglossus kowalevskii]|uniref:Tyramine receptor 2-like n=1 Tax=Saccoglossus kowalevskii TaxID=10224 RepID=A0ABM0GN38_SACKO|nr:PREDICTED: putative tyramine receptor 2-like [Saccoglossus kowalevskii]
MFHYSVERFNNGNESNASLFLDSASFDRNPVHIIASGVILGTIILFTLTGNTLVVIAVLGYRRLQTVTNFLLLSLAIADLTVALLVMPFSLVYEVYGSWTFGYIFCHFWLSCDVMCCTASILNLCIISLDKYWAITRPLTYKVNSKRRVINMVVFVWGCSGTISFIPIFMGWYADSNHPVLHDPYFCGLQVNHTYAIISSLTSFYVPLPIMLFTYSRIYSVARFQAAKIRNELKHIHCFNPSQRQTVRRQIRSLVREHKAVRTLGIIMGVFIFCWLPFFLMYLILPFCPKCNMSDMLKSALTWLGYANSFLNPLIYAFFHRDFRKSFKLILCARNIRFKGGAFQQDNSNLMSRDTMSLANSNNANDDSSLRLSAIDNVNNCTSTT